MSTWALRGALSQYQGMRRAAGAWHFYAGARGYVLAQDMPGLPVVVRDVHRMLWPQVRDALAADARRRAYLQEGHDPCLSPEHVASMSNTEQREFLQRDPVPPFTTF
jgi:hypothetical protein